MRLTISFSGNGQLSPSVSIEDGESSRHLTHPRWMQLFCLMAFRTLNSIENGWVQLNELESLLAFSGVSGRRISKFLAETRSSQPLLVKRFIEMCVHFKPCGPYRFTLPVSYIQTDKQSLDKYISFIYHVPREQKTSLEEMYEEANTEFAQFELGSAAYLYGKCIEKLSGLGNRIPTYAPLIFVNKASCTYLSSGACLKIPAILEGADRAILSIRDSRYRLLFEAYLLDKRIWMTPLSGPHSRQLMEWNTKSMELARGLPKWMGDRAVILAARLYFKLYNAVRYGDDSNYRQTLSLIRDLYQTAEESREVEFVPYEKDMFLAYEVQSDVIDLMRHERVPEHDMISLYQSLLDNNDVSRIGVLSAAEWMTAAFMKANQPEAALEFATEALLDHSHLYQTTVFTRLKTLRSKLKLKTRIG